MKTLFIDTHDEYVKVALFSEGKLYKKEQLSEKSHSIYLVPLLQELMKETSVSFDEINNIVVVNGPGSFTGVRIGLSVAKALSYSKQIDIYEISSLKAIMVSNKINGPSLSFVKDPKGFYILRSDNDEELYVTNIEDYSNKYKFLDPVIDIPNVINYCLANEKTNVFRVKANYVKDIEANNARK